MEGRMGKRRKPITRKKMVPRWHDLNGEDSKIRTVFPKHYSSMMVKPRGGQPVSQAAFKELYSSHTRSLTQTTMYVDEDTEGQFFKIVGEGEPIPPTLLTQEQILADAFVLPQVELLRLKRMVALRNGEIKKELWHELILQEDQFRKLSLCFYANKAIFVEVYKSIKTMATSSIYPSTRKAMAVYKELGFKYISWGSHKPYATEGVTND